MEGSEKQFLFRFAKLRIVHLDTVQFRSEKHFFRCVEQVFRTTIGLLHARHRRVAPRHTSDERTIHRTRHRDVVCEQGFGGTVHNFRIVDTHIGNIPQVFTRRTATVVAHAPKGIVYLLRLHAFFRSRAKHTRSAARCFVVYLFRRFTEQSTVGTAIRYDNRATVGGFPLEETTGVFKLIAVSRTASHIPRVPVFRQNLHQTKTVAECIEVVGNRRFYAEFFLEILFSDANLSNKRFARRHIAVGLQIPPARNLPFALRNEFFYPFK